MNEWKFAEGLKGFQPMPEGLRYDSMPFKLAYHMLYQKAVHGKPYPGTKKERIKVPGYGEDRIGCFVVEPKNYQKGMPAIVYFHGGGFVADVGEANLQVAGWLASRLGCKVFLPEYRTTFKKKYPYQPEDCYQAAAYISGNSEKFGIAPQIALYGDSSGGCLAAAVAQMARDRGSFPILCQMLIYPCMDCKTQGKSYEEYSKAAISTEFVQWLWKFYLDGTKEPIPAYASPLHAKDFSNLPDAYVEPHELDCLRDDGLSYAQRMLDSGVHVECELVKGSYHGVEAEFDTDFVQKLLERRCAFLRRYLEI